MHMWEARYNEASNHLHRLEKEHHEHHHGIGHRVRELREDARKEEVEVHVDNHHAEKYIAKVGELSGEMNHLRNYKYYNGEQALRIDLNAEY